MREIIFGMIYFQHFSENSMRLDRNKRYFIQYIDEARVPADWTRKFIQDIGKEYNEDLSFLVNTVDNLLGQ
jgi:hypothetical protein